MLADIERRGEAAVRDWSRGSTAGRPTRSSSARPRSTAAAAALDDDLKEHIAFAQEQVRAFAERQRATLTDLEVETLPGVGSATATSRSTPSAPTCRAAATRCSRRRS